MDEKTKILVNLAVSIILIVVILYFVNVGQILETLKGADLRFVGLAAIAYLTVNLAMSLRIMKLLEGMGKKIPLITALKADLAGMLASDFTPARSGYFLTAFILTTEEGIELDKSMLSIFGPQLLEFLFKVICTALLVVFLMSRSPIFAGHEIIIFLAVALIILGIVFFLALLFHPTLLERFSFAKIGPMKKLFSLFHLMRSNSEVMVREWPSVIGYTLVGWLAKGVEWYLLSRALGITVIDPVWDYGFFLLLNPFVTFVQFLPLPTLAGAGTGEAAATAVLALMGISLAPAVAFAFLTRGLMIAVDLLGVPTLSRLLRKESLEGVLDEIETLETRI